MQGWKHLISAEKKTAYINALLQVGFDTIDFGSFVSPKAIPQMADTKEVLQKLDLSSTRSKLLAIVANTRGAEEAAAFEEITYLGFPFSVSPTFQMRNTNATIDEALVRVREIKNICDKRNKQPVIYISMGFGNPYGDDYNEEVVMSWTEKLINEGIRIISIADTVGMAKPHQISELLSQIIPKFPSIEIGVHLHATPDGITEKLEAAYDAGCRRFDGALKGLGGCPMADDELTGNMNTEIMLSWFEQQNVLPEINKEALQRSLSLANEIFV